MKRLEVGDNVVLNKNSYWVEQQIEGGYWCSLEGVLVVKTHNVNGTRVKFHGRCLWLDATSFALINNNQLKT